MKTTTTAPATTAATRTTSWTPKTTRTTTFSIDTADEEPDYDPKLPEAADAGVVGRGARRARRRAGIVVGAGAGASASAGARAGTSTRARSHELRQVEQYWRRGAGPAPSPVDHAGALPAMRVSERDDGGISFDFTTMQPEANDDLVTLNPLGGDDVDENEKPGIYRRATPGEAPPPAPAPRVLGVCSSSTCSKDATLRCGVCKVAKYCSVICQRRDWKLHKAVCAPIRRKRRGRTSARAPNE